MITMRKLTAEAERSIIEAYQAWDPSADGVTVEDLAEQHDITRTTLYAVLARNGVPLKSGQGSGPAGVQDAIARRMSLDALEFLYNKLIELELENDHLRATIRDLKR